MKELDEILHRLNELEARVAKLEKAPAATSANSSKREVITHHKRVESSSSDYYKTSEDRVLVGTDWFYPFSSLSYLIELKKILIEIGEEDAIDLSDLDISTFREAQEKKTERYEQFIMQLARLATKYGSKGTLPALLPNDVLLFTNGRVLKTSVSKKAIKF